MKMRTHAPSVSKRSSGETTQHIRMNTDCVEGKLDIDDTNIRATNDNSNPQQGCNIRRQPPPEKKLESKDPPKTSNSFRKQPTLRIPPNKKDSRKLFVGGLPRSGRISVDGAEFKAFFERFGELSDSVVIYDRDTRNSRGFGFVTFRNSSVAQAILGGEGKKSNMITIHDKECEVKVSVPKPNKNNNETNDRCERNKCVTGSGEMKHQTGYTQRNASTSKNHNSSFEEDVGRGTLRNSLNEHGCGYEEGHLNQNPYAHQYSNVDTLSSHVYQGESQPFSPSFISPSSMAMFPQHTTPQPDPNGLFHPMMYFPHQYSRFPIYDTPSNMYPMNVEGQQLYFPDAMFPYPYVMMPFPYVPPLPQDTNALDSNSNEMNDGQKHKRNEGHETDKNHICEDVVSGREDEDKDA